MQSVDNYLRWLCATRYLKLAKGIGANTMGVIERPELLQRHRITVDEYYRMAETGILAPDARVELIEGEIVDMAPMKSRHANVVAEMMERLFPVVRGRARVICQAPLRLGPKSEPEPDLMLVKRRPDGYSKGHPTAADVILVIEVSDSSLRYDRGIKVPLYARHGVPEVWIIDLENELVRFYRQPHGEHYTDITATETPGPTAVAGLDSVSVDLGGLLA